MENLKLVDEFKIFKYVSLILYTYIDNKLQLILHRDTQNQEKYSICGTDITIEDNAPTYAISKKIATEFHGLLSLENLEKISQNQKIDASSTTKDVKWFDLFDNPSYVDWLNILTEDIHSVYQYENYSNDYIIYYKQITIKDLDSLNSNLKQIGINLEFKFFDYDNLNLLKSEINSEILDKLTVINHANYLEDTKRHFSENSDEIFIILSNKEPSDSKSDQAGFYHFPALFQGLYKRNKEKWLLVCSGELNFPGHDTLIKTKAIIIPGSHLNVYLEFDFLRKTEEFLRNVHSNYPKIKILGICFGEQLLVSALGGKVDLLEKKKLDKNYFVVGSHEIKMNEKFWELPFIKKTSQEKKETLNIFKAHGDEVVEFPDIFKNYGRSEICTNEILISDDFRYFLVQGHPEYSGDFNLPRHLSRMKKQKSEEEFREYEQKMKGLVNVSKKLDNVHWRSFCFSFLKN